MARKQKMKVYHGIPKNIVDEHTLFYADYNYIRDNICYENSYYLDRGCKDSAIGLACNKVINVKAGTFDFGATPFTVDIVVENLKSGSSEDMWGCLVGLGVGTTADTNHMDKIISILNYRKNEVHSVGLFGAYVMGNELQTDDTLFIRLAYDGDKTVRGYVNGKLTGQNPINPSDLAKWTGDKNYVLCINTGHNWQGKRNNCYVSEFRISNIDRGDYFPNLPQDFIEGKAIIEPKMNQQQIKGDPAYSQITNIKVPAYVGSNTKLYVIQSDKKGTLLHNPEVFDVDSATTWQVNSSFKLKGLNNEVISGVTDANTALCRITDSPSATVLKVDDVSALSVGDTFRMYRKSQTASNFSSLYTITNINTATKEVTTTEQHSTQVIQDGWICLVETTTSSSSPTVTTKEGTVVNGTWSGLGTSEAKFTLGNNENIQGKDLYVEYSLVIPHGNSDFPELPSIVERAWGENGVEMKPVNEIIITDDFKGKLAGRNKECPHMLYQCLMSSLQPANNISSNIASGFTEISSQSNIYSIETPYDNNLCSTGVTQNGIIPQQLFSFNIIEMIERKLGCEIPSANKIQWVKDNVIYQKITHYGYGIGPNGNRLYFRVFDNGKWGSEGVTTHSVVNASALYWNGATCKDNGCIQLVVYTDASNGATTSLVNTDYISVEIKLKVDSTFTTLYCDNKRAREDVCNPILIQKETKTVKRYLPSNECFTTESLYIKPTTSNISADVLSNYLAKEETFLTTLGSGAYLIHNNVRFKNCINKLGLGIQAYQYDNKPLGKTTVGAYTDLYTIRTLSQPYPTDNLMYPPQSIPNIPCVLMTPYLLNSGGEISLGLLVLELNASGARTAAYTKAYTLPNRPLIK